MPIKKYTATRDYLMFAEAWALLALSRLILIFVPFRKIVPLMTYKGKPQKPVADEFLILERIQVSIARACVRSPWRTKCFEQALTAKMMTRRRGIPAEVFFGVSKEHGQKMTAHAWVKSEEFIVTGWQKMDSYTIVSVF